MPTIILPIHKYRFNGTNFTYSRFSLPFVFLSLLFVFSSLFLPANVQSTFAHPLDQQSYGTLRTVPIHVVPVAAYIKRVNKDLSESDARNFAQYALDAAKEFRIDITVFLALTKIESGFKPELTSNRGAMGLTQVIPKWHTDRIAKARDALKVYSIFEPRLNFYVGAGALRDFLDDSGNNLVTGLLKYNGSLSDPKQSYAKMVMTEAFNIRTFLNAKL